jgi:multiple sugar transport system permease protein
VFVLLPIGLGIWISLYDYDYSLPQQPFVGLDNYTGLLTGSSPYAGEFWSSMGATWLFTALTVPLQLVIALLMNQRFRGRNAFRAVYFAPYVLGVAVVAVLWRYLLDTNIGLVNNYLGAQIPWLTSLPWAWVALVGVTVWWTLGFNAVIYLAALQDISPELYEAARVDGASASSPTPEQERNGLLTAERTPKIASQRVRDVLTRPARSVPGEEIDASQRRAKRSAEGDEV